MSRHGPPGEPYRPGEPYPPYGSYPEPYPDEYAPPSDPWGHAPDPWSGPGAPPPPPGTAPPGPPPPLGPPPPPGGPPRPGAPPGWPGALAGPGRRAAASPAAGPPGGPAAPPGAPSPPPPRRSLGLYLAVAVLVLLAATGVGYALYLLSGDDPEPRAGETPGPESTGQPTGTPGPSDTPRNNVGLSAALAEVGDCLVNDGTAAEPQMRIVRCDDEEENDRFEVLAVFDERVSGEDDEARGASAQAICADTEGYTHHYFEVGEQASFVLCMAEQS